MSDGLASQLEALDADLLLNGLEHDLMVLLHDAKVSRLMVIENCSNRKIILGGVLVSES